jgi:hypothetical protein
MKKQNNLITFIIPSLILAGGIIVASYIFTKDTQFISKSEAVQGCFEVAQGRNTTTGIKEDGGEWIVEEKIVSQLVIDSCLSKKGY